MMESRVCDFTLAVSVKTIPGEILPVLADESCVYHHRTFFIGIHRTPLSHAIPGCCTERSLPPITSQAYYQSPS